MPTTPGEKTTTNTHRPSTNDAPPPPLPNTTSPPAQRAQGTTALKVGGEGTGKNGGGEPTTSGSTTTGTNNDFTSRAVANKSKFESRKCATEERSTGKGTSFPRNEQPESGGPAGQLRNGKDNASPRRADVHENKSESRKRATEEPPTGESTPFPRKGQPEPSGPAGQLRNGMNTVPQDSRETNSQELAEEQIAQNNSKSKTKATSAWALTGPPEVNSVKKSKTPAQEKPLALVLFEGSEEEGAKLSESLRKRGWHVISIGDCQKESTHINKRWCSEKLPTLLRNAKVVFLSPPCKLFSQTQLQFTKSKEQLSKLQTRRKYFMNDKITPLLKALKPFIEGGGCVMWEQPKYSTFWKTREWRTFYNSIPGGNSRTTPDKVNSNSLTNKGYASFDQCMKKNPFRKPTKIAIIGGGSENTLEHAELKTRGLQCDHSSHEKQCLGNTAKKAAFYNEEIATVLADIMANVNNGYSKPTTSLKEATQRRISENIEYAKQHPNGVEVIVDTGAQITVFHKSAVRTITRTGKLFNTVGVGHEQGKSSFERSNVATVLTLEDGSQIVGYFEDVGVGRGDTRPDECNLVDPFQINDAGHHVEIFDKDGDLGGIVISNHNNASLNGKRVPFTTTSDSDIGLTTRPPTNSEMKNLTIVKFTNSGYSRKEHMKKYGKQPGKASFTIHNINSIKPKKHRDKDTIFLNRIKSFSPSKTNSNTESAEQVTLDEINPTTMREKMSPRRKKNERELAEMENADKVESRACKIHQQKPPRKPKRQSLPTTSRLRRTLKDRQNADHESHREFQATFGGKDEPPAFDKDKLEEDDGKDIETIHDHEEGEDNDDDCNDLDLTPPAKQRAIVIGGYKGGTLPTLKSPSGNDRERGANGKHQLDPRAFGNPSRATLENTKKFTTLFYGASEAKLPTQSWTKYPALTSTRVDTEMSCDPIQYQGTTRQQLQYMLVMVYPKTGLTKGVGLMNLRGETLAAAIVDFMKDAGIPSTIRTDGAKYFTLGAFAATCKAYHIHHEISERGHQYQNPSEFTIGKIRLLAAKISLIAREEGVPVQADEEHDLFTHAIHIHNLTATKGRTPTSRHHGNTPDLSALNRHFFGQILWMKTAKSDKREDYAKVRYIGMAPAIGNAFCFLVRHMDDRGGWCGQVIATSAVSVYEDQSREKQADKVKTATANDLRGQQTDGEESVQSPTPLADYDPESETPETEQELPSRGSTARGARGARLYSGGLQEAQEQPDDDDADTVYDIDEIVSHKVRGGGKKNDPKIASNMDVLISWTGFDDKGEPWENSYIPLFEKANGIATQAAEDGGTPLGDAVATYIMSHTEDGTYKRAKNWATQWIKDHSDPPANELPEEEAIPVARYRFSTNEWKYGICIPKGIDQALEFDKRYKDDPKKYKTLLGGRTWGAALKKEKDRFYTTGIGKNEEPALRVLAHGEQTPSGSQNVRCFWVFDVKPDMTLKARWVAGGNTIESFGATSSTVMSMTSVRILFIQAQKDGQKILSGDLSNAYLHARTDQLVHTTLGKEWEADSGKTVIIVKAMYGLRTSGRRFHLYVEKSMYDMGWKPSRGDRDVWMRYNEESGLYDYVGFYVDDLLCIGKDPEKVIEELKEYFSFKIAGPPDRFLGMDIRTVNGVMFLSSRSYVTEVVRGLESSNLKWLDHLASLGTKENWIANRERKFPTERHEASLLKWNKAVAGSTRNQLRPANSPMGVDFAPRELEGEDAILLGADDIRLYQKYIGCLIWIIQLGRFQVCHATSTLGQFLSAPQAGHMKAVMVIFGYLKAHDDVPIGISAEKIDSLPEPLISQAAEMREAYPDAVESLDETGPVGHSEAAALTVFVDANHASEVSGRRSVTGVLVYLGSTMIKAFSKRQLSITASTHESEFIAMKAAVQEVMGLRYILRSMGWRIDKPTLVLGDNESVLTNSTQYDSMCKKKHVGIAYHLCREAFASGSCIYAHIPSNDNIADVLTKSLPGPKLNQLCERGVLRPHYHGKTDGERVAIKANKIRRRAGQQSKEAEKNRIWNREPKTAQTTSPATGSGE